MASHELLKVPNVVGFGEGFRTRNGDLTDEKVTVVLVTEKLPEVQLSAHDRLPGEYDVVQVGVLRAQQSRTVRRRPCPGGMSIGHKDITAGTFGVRVYDRETDDVLMLSNNHVLANSNAGKRDDLILQPGPIDGGGSADVIATLERFIQIAFEGGCLPFNAAPNLVDAAVAKPVRDTDVLPEILDIGVITGTLPAELGQSVRKSGRTTGFTTGTIQVLHAIVTVNYGSAGNAVFEDQIISGPMSAGGDSGSLLVDGGGEWAVGLLYAGSDEVTIYNPIKHVLEKLDIRL